MEAKTSDWRPGPSVCRCCLTEGCYKDISTEYFWMGKKEIYSEMLSDTFSISIAYSQSGPNSNSRLICEPCIARLRDASDFRRQVVECEKTFMQHLDPGMSSSADIEILAETVDYEVKLERVKTEKPLSDDDFDDADFLDDDDDDDMDDEPLTKLASKVPKKESVDLLDLLDNSKPSLKRKSATKVKASPTKKSKTKKDTAKPATSKVTKPEKKKKVTGYKRQTTSKWALTLSERENAANFLLYTTANPFTYLTHPFCFKCLYCEEKESDILPILQHTSTHEIPKREEMMKNFLKKGKKTLKVDISNLKCRICHVVLTDLESARKHLTDHHLTAFTSSGNGIIAYNLKTINGVFSCHICSEKFNSFFLLNKHIGVHYSNAICDTCGKGFVSHKRLLEHKEIHQKHHYTCGKCKLEFNSIHKLKYHMGKLHMGTNKVKSSKCQLCTERFEYHYEKMKHLSEKHGISFDFNCDVCKAVFKTRKALGAHKIKIHMQNIMCDVCKKPFSERSHLKKHMAMHTEERNYNCPLCTKTYRYEKNLKQHMRLHNPEWKFACSLCWIGFNSKMEFRRHNKELHS